MEIPTATHRYNARETADLDPPDREPIPAHLRLFCNELGALPRRPKPSAPLGVPRDHLRPRHSK